MGIIVDAYAIRKHIQSMKDTWGHLAPKQNQNYKGRVVFVGDFYGGFSPIILICNFEGLSDSPWLFDSLQTYLHSLHSDIEPGYVYEFLGVFKNGNFNGEVRVLLDTNLTAGICQFV